MYDHECYRFLTHSCIFTRLSFLLLVLHMNIFLLYFFSFFWKRGFPEAYFQPAHQILTYNMNNTDKPGVNVNNTKTLYCQWLVLCQVNEICTVESTAVFCKWMKQSQQQEPAGSSKRETFPDNLSFTRRHLFKGILMDTPVTTASLLHAMSFPNSLKEFI